MLISKAIRKDNDYVYQVFDADRMLVEQEFRPGEQGFIPMTEEEAIEFANKDIERLTTIKNIPYEIDKSTITTSETATITTEATTAIIEDEEYEVDGVIEYSNENVGIHTIILKQDRHKDTVVEIEVIAG